MTSASAGRTGRPAGQLVGESRNQLDQPLGRIAGPSPRDAFQIASAQQQEHEHGHRIKIDAVVDVAEERPAAGEKCGEDADGDRHVHADPAAAQVTPGTLVKRPRRIQHHRQGQDQAGPVQHPQPLRVDVAVRCQIGRHDVHHHLHHRQAGHPQAVDLAFAFLLRQLFLAVGIIRVGAVADAGNGFQDL